MSDGAPAIPIVGIVPEIGQVLVGDNILLPITRFIGHDGEDLDETGPLYADEIAGVICGPMTIDGEGGRYLAISTEYYPILSVH